MEWGILNRKGFDLKRKGEEQKKKTRKKKRFFSHGRVTRN